MLAVLALGTLAGAAQAGAPAISLLPKPNPAQLLAGASVAGGADEAQPVLPLIRPKLRPAEEAALAQQGAQPAGTATPISPLAVAASLRPSPRPEIPVVVPAVAAAMPQPAAIPASPPPERSQSLIQRILFTVPPGAGITQSQRGGLCGDPQIQGEKLAPVVSRVQGCGIPVAVKVTSVAGVALSTPATINCETAVALKHWVATGLKPAVGTEGGGVKSLVVFDSYQCRPVDNIGGEKLSLHAKGMAIDIGGYTLASGETVMVASDWRKKGEGQILRAAYHAACGIFGTTLGPDGDRYHQTHMHFDTAHYAGGSYCH